MRKIWLSDHKLWWQLILYMILYYVTLHAVKVKIEELTVKLLGTAWVRFIKLLLFSGDSSPVRR